MATVVFQSTLLASHVARCCAWVSALQETQMDSESSESGESVVKTILALK